MGRNGLDTPGMATNPEIAPEARRGAAPADEAYLRRVGERVRLARARRGMSRKSLSRASGVSRPWPPVTRSRRIK